MLPNAQQKGEPRKRLNARRRRLKKARRQKCCEIVFERAGGCCERCGRSVTYDVHPLAPNRAHVNEPGMRSKGADPTDPSQAELLCRTCHLPDGQHMPTPARLAQYLADKAARKAKREAA